MMQGMELTEGMEWNWEFLFVVLIFGFGFQVKEVAPEARRRDAMLSFAFVYPTKTGHFTIKEVKNISLYYLFIFLHLTLKKNKF